MIGRVERAGGDGTPWERGHLARGGRAGARPSRLWEVRLPAAQSKTLNMQMCKCVSVQYQYPVPVQVSISIVTDTRN